MKEDSFAIGIIETPQDEYINKTWLVQKLNEAVTEIKEKVPDQPDYAAIVETLAQTINKIQPADVVEVRHGRWEAWMPDKNGETREFICTGCRFMVEMSWKQKECDYEWCPYCGYKMDKEC